MTPNDEITKAARTSLAGQWGWAALGAFIYQTITVGISFLPVEVWLSSLLGLLVTGPMLLGFSTFVLALQGPGEASLGRLFDGFDGFGRLGTSIGGYFLMTLFILLWMLLLIVPGFVAIFSYSMTFWILADDPDAGPLEALSRSKAMMHGHRWQLFRLYCRFLGWVLLGLLTLGIGWLWVLPYLQMSFAEFYRQLKDEKAEALPS